MRLRVLLLPGLEGSGRLFNGLIGELASDIEAHAVRYPIECRTYAEVLPVIREQLGGSRPLVVIAESFSTPAAIEIAASARDEIDALVLCNGFVTSPLGPFASMIAAATAPLMFNLPLTSFAVRTFLAGPDASEELIDPMIVTISTVPASTLTGRFHAVLQCDAKRALTQLAIPILYLHSTRDRLIGENGLREIQRVRPDIAVERVDGPHLPLQKEPRRCAEILMEFIRRVISPLE